MSSSSSGKRERERNDGNGNNSSTYSLGVDGGLSPPATACSSRSNSTRSNSTSSNRNSFLEDKIKVFLQVGNIGNQFAE